MRPLLTFWDRMSYPAWQRLGDTIRRTTPRELTFDFSPEDQAIFSAGVEAASMGGAMALAESYDFSRHKKLIDIGGGTGSFLRVIRRRHPQSGDDAVRTARHRGVRAHALHARRGEGNRRRRG
jgi:hypothetical protein